MPDHLFALTLLLFLFSGGGNDCLVAQSAKDFSTQEEYWEHLDSMARKVYGTTQADSNLHYFGLMEAWALNQSQEKWRRLVWQRRGKFLYDIDNYLEAILDFKRLIASYPPETSTKEISITYRKLAYCLRKTGSVTEAKKNYELSIHHALQIGEEGQLSLANAYNGFGSLLLNLRYFQLAEAKYQAALGIYESINSQAGIAASLNNLALVSIRSGKPEAGRQYLLRSLEIKTELNNQRGIANTLANLGDLAYEQANYATAQDYHLRSIAIRDSLNLSEDITQSYARMGEIALALNAPNEALDWCLKCREIATQGSYWESTLSSNLCLYQAYDRLEQWNLALDAFEVFHSVHDSILGAGTASEIASINSDYAYEREIAESEQKRLNLKVRFKKKRAWLNTLMLLFLPLCFLLIFLYKKNKTRKKQAQNLQNSNVILLQERDAISQRSKTLEERLESYQSMVMETPVSSTSSEQAVEATPEASNKPQHEWQAELDLIIDDMIIAKQQLSASQIASKMYLSERQLLRKIKTTTGLSTQQYLQQAKLKMAHRWLTNGSYKKVKDLAEDLGFKSPYYFTKLFTKKFGKKPSEFL